MFGIEGVLGVFFAYAIGSMPVGRWITTIYCKDSTDVGLKPLALARVLADIVKGAFAVMVFCKLIGHGFDQYGVLLAYLGHRFPICRKCWGGNGIAVLLGALTVLHPLVGLTALISWLFTYYVFRYASLSALTSAIMTPLVSGLAGIGEDLHILFIITAMIFVQQKGGLKRLLAGDEERVSWS